MILKESDGLPWLKNKESESHFQESRTTGLPLVSNTDNISRLSYGILDQLKMSIGRDDVERVERLGSHLQKFRQETIEVAEALLAISREFHQVFLGRSHTIK